MLDKEKPVQGLTVYAEFVKPGYRTELFITPDGFTNSGEATPAKIHTRIVTRDKPKKLWEKITIRFADEIATLGVKDIHISLKDLYVDERLSHLTAYFHGLTSGDWQIVKTPILIETTQSDITLIAKGETPEKLVYRINQSRKALGFPVEIA
jgi:hypothetical protein